MGRSRWEVLNWQNEERSKNEAEKNAAQILIIIISSDLKKRLGLKENQSPSSRDLIQHGYQDFVSAYKRHGLKLSDIIKKANLKPKISIQSWKNLTFESAVEYFIEIIKSNEIPLEQNRLPTRKQLRNSKFKNFVSAISNRSHLTLKEIKNEVKLRLNLVRPIKKRKEKKIQNKTAKFKDKVKPISNKLQIKSISHEKLQSAARNYKTSKNYNLYLNKAKNRLLKNIIPIANKKINLKPWQVPSKQQLCRCGCEDFLIFMEKNHLIYREIVELAGMEIQKTVWSGLNANRAASYLLNEILNSKKIRNLNLEKGEVPSKNQLIKNGYGNFVTALYKRGILYSEVVDETGLHPHPKDTSQEAGINAHWILEKIFLQYTRENNLLSYYEIYPSNLHHKNKSDNAILKNQNFKQKIEEQQSVLTIPNSIKLINIEYYSGSDLETIIQKCQKDYQGERKFLIIVSLSTQKKK